MDQKEQNNSNNETRLTDELADHYRLIIEGAIQPIYTIHTDGTLLFMNTNAASYFNSTPENLIGKTVWDLFPQENADWHIQKIHNASEKGTPIIEETEIEIGDKKRWFEIKIIPTITEEKNLTAAICFLNDITERKRSKIALKESESKLKEINHLLESVLDTIPDMIGIQKPDHTVVMFNKAGYEFMGTTHEDSVGKKCYELIKRNDECDLCATNMALETKKVQQIQKYYEAKSIWLDSRSYPVLDENGEVLLVIEHSRDITEYHNVMEALKTSEERFRNLVETSTDWIWEIDENFNYTYSSPQVEIILGYSPQEILGKAPTDIMDEIEKERITRLVQPIIEKRDSIIRLENRVIHKNGNQIILETSGSPFFDSKGEFRGYRGVDRDITERKVTEITLAESENKYREFFEEDLTADYITSVDGHLVDCNTAFLKMYGFKTKKEAIGFRVKNLYHDMDVRARFIEEIKAKRKVTNYLMENQKLDGTKIVTNQNARGKFDKEGNLQFVNGYVIDITEAVNSGKALKENEAMLQSIFRAAPVGIGVVVDRVFSWTNDTLAKITGYSAEEMIGQNAVMLYNSQAEYERAGQEKYGKIEKYGTGTVETKWTRKNGEIIDVLLSSTPIDPKNLKAGVTFSVQDITRRKRMEDDLVKSKEVAERANNLKTEFLAQMSHEIRTPINTILSFSQLVREEFENIVNDDLKTSFHGISNAGQRIIRTVDLLLNMSEVQAGSYDYNPRRLDLRKDILEDLYLEYYSVAKAKGLQLEFNNSDDLFILNVDEYTVKQIFANLLDNAIKYTEKGIVKIECLNIGDKVAVKIVDSGIGISEHYMPYLFEPFMQEEQGYTRKFEGNGLGLALIKKYCELNNAEISVKSKKGEGSTFSVSFLNGNKNI